MEDIRYMIWLSAVSYIIQWDTSIVCEQL